ncbi:NAD(+) synthase [uncultured Sphaerochaeta sp.]|uniref:NAD(+) synthase n=1 Tax=uncultured Sphaerochaeta sp. TaxID=886478 RepID=UPI002A0A70FE|nr:NAD(+) synthase [uncultured Sphaerochaeta sp.]
MKDGFISCAAYSATIRVADCTFNVASLKQAIDKAAEKHLALLVLPELVVTGYTCADLFLQVALQREARKAIAEIALYSTSLETVIVFGAPLVFFGHLYNCGVVVQKGRILGIVPKQNIPNYQEYYEKRWFSTPDALTHEVEIEGLPTLFGTHLLFACRNIPDFVLGVEICEDLWVPLSPSTSLALAGATVIANCSASDELVGKKQYRRNLVSSQSAKLICAYIYSDAGSGESSTDLVFCGHNLIYENGTLLGEQFNTNEELLVTELDTGKLAIERMRVNTFDQRREVYTSVYFDLKEEETQITRFVDPAPFVPSDPETRDVRCEKIMTLQALGLKKRLEHTQCKDVIIGLSGGLDSTLALLVCVQAFDLLKLDRKGIRAITMPCFGTTKRTKGNATALARELGVSFSTIPIKKAVLQHFKDIGHDGTTLDVTYENCQARERTQVLMDLANFYKGLVIGTGDLSELALGWATYNGDHMSMYGVNCSVPKSLVRHLVHYVAMKSDQGLKTVLLDVIATPVSPELLPATKEGAISQVTEDIVGPYELHDFFLYQIVRWGFSPRKVLRLALVAFDGTYDRQFIKKWLQIFYKRFFSQQFKRSCLPDGPKVGSVTLSPRGDWRMPSDASVAVWMEEFNSLE